MQPIGEPGAFNPEETDAVEWVPITWAPSYLGQTINPLGRQRDLAALEAAVAERKRLL